MASRRFWLFGCFVCLLGCSKGSPELMPLEPGRTVTYTVTAGLERFVEPIQTQLETPIAGVTGYELSGPMGVSRVAWKDGVLLAKQTANARFEPPIPLLTVDGKKRVWSGRMESLGKFSDATAELIQKEEKIRIGTREVKTVLAILTVSKAGGTIELSSWFQPGVGLVQQEQRTAGRLILRMEILGSPQSPP